MGSEIIFKGMPSSPGLALGEIFIIHRDSILIPSERIPVEKIPEEMARFDSVMKELIAELDSIIHSANSEPQNVLNVLETHWHLLSDEILKSAIKNRIGGCLSAENAVIQEFDSQKQYLLQSKDNLLRERAIDIEQIKERIISGLHHRDDNYKIPIGSVIVAQSVTPTEIIKFKESGVIGIITEAGGITSHSSILARTFEIPAVIGVKDVIQILDFHKNEIDEVFLDGYTGSIFFNPTVKTVELFIDKKNKEDEHRKELGELVKLPSQTIDGTIIHLLANIDSLEDLDSAMMAGAEGVGLVRSEHLVLALQFFPDEEQQFQWYREIAQRAYPHPVTIRAFDVGSDKYAEGMSKHENNPALGFRGIRFLLYREDLFITQIRAILKASKNKNLKFMLPMISHFNEVILSLSLIKRCKDMLREENIMFDENMPVGVMIETPAAALIADKLAEHSDFFSIGSNDLTQYTLAADRTNDLVTDIYDAFHPSVLKLIKMATDAAKKKGIPISICGELAGHAAATELLIGLGIHELSVVPAILPELKKRIRALNLKKAKKIANEILKYNSLKEITSRLELA